MYCDWFPKEIITREHFVIDDIIKMEFLVGKRQREVDERETI